MAENTKSDQLDNLHAAVKKQCVDTVKLLIERSADVNERNHQGNTPLHLAACSRSTAIIKALVEGGANLNGSNFFGTTPLYEAAVYLRTDNVKLLLDLGADVHFNRYGKGDFVMRLSIHPEVIESRILIQKELIRLKAVGRLRESMWPYISDEIPGIEVIKTDCLAEIYKMKEELCPDHWITWFDILRSSKKEAAAFCQNANLKKKLNVAEIERTFPIYHKVLERKIIDGSRTAQLEMESYKILCGIFTALPGEITRMISQCLDENQQKFLVNCL